MLTEPQREFLKQAVRQMQIVVGALGMGVAVFMSIVAFMPSLGQGGANANELPIAYIGVGAAMLAIVAWAIVPGLIAGRARQAIVDGSPQGIHPAMSAGATEAGDVAPLAAVYQTRLIIGGAILEGAAFFNLIAYMMQRQTISLVAAGVLLLMLLSQIPTLGRLEQWVESELAAIEQDRLMSKRDG